MKLQKITISNFKKVEKAVITFEETVQILVGPNNIGKSSLIQGILMAYQSLRSLFDNQRIIFGDDEFINLEETVGKKGIRLNKFSFLLDNPINLFNVKVGASSTSIEMFKLYFEEDKFITLSAAYVGESFSVRVTEASSNISLADLKEFLNAPIVLIPSFFTVTINEERKSPARYMSLVKNGNYNQLFRNILLDLKNTDISKFEKLVNVVEEVLGIRGLYVEFDEDTDEFINAYYLIKGESKNTRKIDVSSLGMGTLQFIQVFAQILLGKSSLILLDEPDAHLHSKLQVRIVEKLKELSGEYNIKFIIATHSKDIINNVNLSQVLSLGENGEVSRVNDSNGVMRLLNILGATTEELMGVKLGKRIIILEGEDDVEYLLELCKCFELDKEENFSNINFVPLGGRDKVLSNQLMAFFTGEHDALDEFNILAIFDRDYRILEHHISEAEKLKNKGFDVLPWSKKELENYFLNIPVIIKVINEKYPQDNVITTADINLIIEEVYEDYKEDYLVSEYTKYLEQKKKNGEETPIKEYGETVIRELKNEAREILRGEEKINLVPGKEVIKRIRSKLIIKNTPQQKQFVVEIIKNLNTDNIDEDLNSFFEFIRTYSR